MKQPITYLILILLFLSGLNCTSYEEGPEFSVWPVNQRVINTWTWGYSLQNDLNLTGEYADSLIEFTNEGIVRICDTTLQNCRQGTWNLVRKKSKLQMVFGEKATAYDIRMLRKDEMWLYYDDVDREVITEWELIPAK